MAVTIYRSTDVGAPTLPANSNYVKASYFMDIIKQCLVTGYGSKPGAGWTLRYEDTTANKRRLAVSNGNGVMEFITWGTVSVAMVMWDSITTPGSGRLYDDSFASVMSAGINGWKSPLIAAPGTAAENICGINLSNIHLGFESSIAWTVYANDKSVWVLFHYPEGNTNSEGTDSLSTAGTLHPQLFFGAVKSPDLERDQMGNFFALTAVRGPATSAISASGGNNSIQYQWGLRTPQNTIPSVSNNSSFSLTLWADGNNAAVNPYSSIRVLFPVVMGYMGADVVKPASLASNSSNYQFGAIPGLAQFASAGNQLHYWLYLNTERSASWNMQTYTVNGIDWMPWSLSGSTASFGNCGITDDYNWWA